MQSTKSSMHIKKKATVLEGHADEQYRQKLEQAIRKSLRQTWIRGNLEIGRPGKLDRDIDGLIHKMLIANYADMSPIEYLENKGIPLNIYRRRFGCGIFSNELASILIAKKFLSNNPENWIRHRSGDVLYPFNSLTVWDFLLLRDPTYPTPKDLGGRPPPKYPKYRNVPLYPLSSDSNGVASGLFGLTNISNKSRHVYIVEGALCAMQLENIGISGGIASGNTKLTVGQFSLLVNAVLYYNGWGITFIEDNRNYYGDLLENNQPQTDSNKGLFFSFVKHSRERVDKLKDSPSFNKIIFGRVFFDEIDEKQKDVGEWIDDRLKGNVPKAELRTHFLDSIRKNGKRFKSTDIFFGDNL